MLKNAQPLFDLEPQSTPAETSVDYRAVEINPGFTWCCQPVKPLAGVRYLTHQAPALPLSNCSDPAGCKCRYIHHDDRRRQPRRETG